MPDPSPQPAPVDPADPAVPEELARFRGSIDNLDAALIHLLAERFKLTRQVGEFKARTSLPPADPAREARQIERLRALSAQAELDPAIAEKFLTFVVTEVVRHHEAIAEEHRRAQDDGASDDDAGNDDGA